MNSIDLLHINHYHKHYENIDDTLSLQLKHYAYIKNHPWARAAARAGAFHAPVRRGRPCRASSG